jgi:hypothetical protein
VLSECSVQSNRPVSTSYTSLPTRMALSTGKLSFTCRAIKFCETTSFQKATLLSDSGPRYSSQSVEFDL